MRISHLSLPGERTGLYPIMWCFPGRSGSLTMVHQ